MQGFKECGDVKAVMLTINAIAYFHKTVQDFSNAVAHFSSDGKKRYCELLVAEYQQFMTL